jgi:hypothetical protein
MNENSAHPPTSNVIRPSSFIHRHLSIVIRHSPLAICYALFAGVAALALGVYLATLAPVLSFQHHGADGGDLIAAAATLGVPHPTGYPTYTLLAWLFSHLPFGTLAYRVNLLSAVCAAAAAGLLVLIARMILPADNQPTLVAAASGLTLAFSSLLWSQAVIAEVYALLTLFAVLLIWLLLRWRRGGRDGYLWLAALTLGLGLGNHVTLVLGVPAVLALLWPQRQRWLRVRVLAPAAALVVLGVCIYVYLPWAAGHRPPVNWGNPRTWGRFLWVVTARQYQSFAFGLKLEQIPARISDWAALLGDQFGWWGLALSLAGLWSWWHRDRALALFSTIWIGCVGIYAFFYDTGDAEVYLLPAVLLMALWWGEGAGWLLGLANTAGTTDGEDLRIELRRGSRSAHPANPLSFLPVVILILPLVSAGMHWRAADLSGDWSVQTFIRQSLDSVEPGGLVVVRGDRPTFALWYAVYAEGQRPDVALVNGPMLAYVWYREQIRQQYPSLTLDEPPAGEVTTDDLVHELIADNQGGRPVYATDPPETWKAWFQFISVGEAPIYRVEVRSAPGQ